MKILVTGAKGFVGENLIAELKNIGYNEIYECDTSTTELELDEYIKNCEFVFHFAGKKRVEDEAFFMESNYGFTATILEKLKQYNNKAPILFTSSILAELDTTYAKSKKQAEDILFEYENQANTNVIIYRLSNLYGKWSQCKYNGVVSEFCKNISRDIPVEISDKDTEIKLMYIQDVVREFTNVLQGNGNKQGKYYEVPVYDNIKLGELVEVIKGFKSENKAVFDSKFNKDFIQKLYSTYLAYSPKEK